MSVPEEPLFLDRNLMRNIKKFIKMLFSLKNKQEAWQLVRKVYNKIRPSFLRKKSGRALLKKHFFCIYIKF